MYQLIEVLSKDISNQLHKILAEENLMFGSYSGFKGSYEKAEEIFKKFQDSMSAFMSNRSTSSSLSRMIASSSNQPRTAYHYNPLKSRL